MYKYYNKKEDTLIFLRKSADSEYWDTHWNDKKRFKDNVLVKNNMVLNLTRKYLQSGLKILEGGCGRGQNVFTLKEGGYEVYGVDYAMNTVKKIGSSDFIMGIHHILCIEYF